MAIQLPDPDRLARWRSYRSIRREVYSPFWIVLLTSFAAVLVLLIILQVGHASLLREFTMTLAIISSALFIMLAIGFYRGIRIRREKISLKPREAIEVGKGDLYTNMDMADLVPVVDDFPGCLISVVIAISIALFFPLILWLAINLFWVAIPLAFAAIYYVLSRALRQIFLRSHRTRGRVGRSIAYAFIFTTLYTSWFWLLLSMIDFIKRH